LMKDIYIHVVHVGELVDNRLLDPCNSSL